MRDSALPRRGRCLDALLIAAILATASCDGTATPGGGQGGTSGQGGAGGGAGGNPGFTDADLQFCVDEINRFRATLSLPPYTRSSTLEACAAEGAQSDGNSHTAHGHFKSTGGCGYARAENEIPGWAGWTLDKWGSVHDVIVGGLQLMWDEGPGTGADHGHYNAMSSKTYTQVGCGIWISPAGEVTVVQDFK